MIEAIYDKKDQYDRIAELIVPGETLYAVFDMVGGGTGFVGITDLRLVFMDESFVRKQKNIISLPYRRVDVVGFEDSGKGLMSWGKISKLFITSGDRVWEFAFRTNEKAKEAYMLIMRNLLQTEEKGLLVS